MGFAQSFLIQTLTIFTQGRVTNKAISNQPPTTLPGSSLHTDVSGFIIGLQITVSESHVETLSQRSHTGHASREPSSVRGRKTDSGWARVEVASEKQGWEELVKAGGRKARTQGTRTV